MPKRTGELIEMPLFAALEQRERELEQEEAERRRAESSGGEGVGVAEVALPDLRERVDESRTFGGEVRPGDAAERERALDVARSWVVEAPAGSGKTGLLIQRYLKLLAEGGAERPEQVMAITFTNAATDEIRERVVEQLRGAAEGTDCRGEFAGATRSLAEAVLRRDREKGWGLLDAPQRLNVRTIDSVCGEIARSLPVTSGGGAALTPVEEPEGLYREAARRTAMQLGGADGLLDEALRTSLLHRDGNLQECMALIAQMLRARDQWGELVPVGREATSEEWLEGTVRRRLDATLERVVSDGLFELKKVIPAGTLDGLSALAKQMVFADEFGGEVSGGGFVAAVPGTAGETVADLRRWRAVVSLLVTKTFTWRKNMTADLLNFFSDPSLGKEVKGLIATLQDEPGVLEAIKRFSRLPPPRYPEEQWVVAKALFRVLNRALAELKVVFAERGECDFAEPALLAMLGLKAGAVQEAGVDAYEAATGVELRHLLVDEMQDTSMNQYRLLEEMTEGWAGEGKTVFLVGDPKQSIYLFRQARVERFVEMMRTERMGELTVGCLRLTANFRSQAGLVEEFNRDFEAIFPPHAGGAGEVPFVRAEAVRGEATEVAGEGGAMWHATAAGGSTTEQSAEMGRLAKRGAREIREIVEEWKARPLPEGRKEPWRIAVLVRARTDLKEVVAEFKRDREGVSIPFRAVKVEPLGERREVLDLLALTRALKHPADRAAWWAVLLAPWCGLRLADVHVLAGQDAVEFRRWTVMELVRERGDLLTADGIARVERVWPVLHAAAEKAGRVRLPELVERTWRSLGGDAYLDAAEMANAREFLRLLDEVESDAGEVEIAELERRMERLFGAAVETPGAVDLLTIHSAKGLEWDVVIVPRMERRPPVAEQRLLDWEEMSLAREGDAAPVVLAPISGKGEESQALNKWVRGLRSERESAERRRLFYVACTRAREELHLFGTACVGKDGGRRAETGSLLEAAWPAAEGRFAMGRVVEMPRREEEAEEAEPGVLDLAANAEELAVGPEEERPRVIERLPLAFDALGRFVAAGAADGREAEERGVRFARPEGSFAARSLGNAVHAFLELAARRMADGASAAAVVREVSGWKARVGAVLRGDGMAPEEVERHARRVLGAVTGTLEDETGQWLLGRRMDARSEYALRTAEGGSVRLDRVFRAGEEPLSDGEDCLWVVDYKTGSHGSAGLEEWLLGEKEKYRGQMEAYARALGEGEVRVGLWFAMVRRLVWWVVLVGSELRLR